jgi:hypothetical protein
MKKALVLLLLVAMVAPVFAEDAKVLPQGVGRLYTVPGFAWASAEFDDDGDKEDLDDSIQFANFAGALEYGALPWISVGLKWIPGYVYYSDLGVDNATANGASDLEIGAKMQIVGPNAPVASSAVRWTVTPGVLVPLAGPDWSEEFANRNAGKEFVAQAPSNHALGLGFQTAVDYVVNDSFFVSLFGEGRFYQAKEFKDVNLEAGGTYASIASGSFEVDQPGTALDGQTISGIAVAPPTQDVNLGYDLNLELAAHYETTISQGVRFGANLPVDFRYTPGLSADDYTANADFTDATLNGNPLVPFLTGVFDGEDDPEATAEATADTLEAGFEQNATSAVKAVFDETDSYSLVVTPGVSFFFTAIPLPIEVTLDWAVPVLGQNTLAQNSLSSQIRFYFAF